MKKLLRGLFSKNFLVYILIGTFNTLSTAVYASLCDFLFNEHIAAYAAFILSLSVGYLLNARFNFHRRISFLGYLRFMAVYIPHFIIFAAISSFALGVLEFPPFWATVLASASGAPVTFLIMRFFAFGNKKHENAQDEDI